MPSTKSEDVEVRLIDQEQINEFGRLNTKLLELRAELKQAKNDYDKLDDSTSELMLAAGGKVMVFIGESFIETDEDFATEYCNKRQEELQKNIDEFIIEEKKILERQSFLKKELYHRFGDSINLEN